METYDLAHTGAHTARRVHVVLIHDPRNASAVLERVKRGDVPLQCAIIDARMLTSIEHLFVAVHQAILRKDSQGANLKTKGIHSEIMWNLSMTSNIMESFRVFGLSEKTRDVIVVHVEGEGEAQQESTQASILAHIRDVIDGDYDEHGPSAVLTAWRRSNDGADVASAQGVTDWDAVKEAYRLTDEATSGDGEGVDLHNLDGNARRLRRLQRIDSLVTSTVAVKFVAS